MKRATLALFALLLVAAMLVPALALATEATTTKAATSALITYPRPQPDATAAEARAETQWQKPGDVMNLAFALVGLGGIFGVIAWGIVASRRSAAV